MFERVRPFNEKAPDLRGFFVVTPVRVRSPRKGGGWGVYAECRYPGNTWTAVGRVLRGIFGGGRCPCGSGWGEFGFLVGILRRSRRCPSGGCCRVRLYSWGNGSGLWAAARLRACVDHQEAPAAAAAELVVCALNAAWDMGFWLMVARGRVRAC